MWCHGATPHKLVEETMNRHHIPGKFRDLIFHYYNSFSLKVSAGSTTTGISLRWESLLGAPVILFAPSMPVKSAAVQSRGPLTKSDVWQPSIRALMDDLTVTITSVPGSRRALKGREEIVTWARMRSSTSRDIGKLSLIE